MLIYVSTSCTIAIHIRILKVAIMWALFAVVTPAFLFIVLDVLRMLMIVNAKYFFFFSFFDRGEDIFISVWNLHRCPKHWDDADKFNPERWPLDGPNPNETNQNFRYII